jgi:flagellar hook protein FlgE
MSFRTALSGLNAAQTDLNVTGNNIANANTTGFKQSRTEFSDVYAVSFLGVSNTTAGSGVRVAEVSQQFAQGNVEFTSNNLDLAINGEGFYILNDNGSNLYTRAGAFHVDRQGYVVNSEDNRLQIYPATAAGNFDTGVLQDLQLSTGEGPPNPTSTVDVSVNLGAGDSEPALAFDPANPDTYNNASSIVIYDSLGTAHTQTMYFRKDETTPPGVNLWDSYVYVDGNQVTSGGNPSVQLSFNNDGSLATPMPINYDPIVTTTGSQPISMGVDFSGTTQFGSPFTVNSLTQDGFATGRLAGIDIGSTGEVSARYTNGQSQILGKIALSSFPNPQGLGQQGDTAWSETFTSGDRLLGSAGTGTFGLIQSGALEASNVDVAEQLVSLITAQRNYQASAQVISTEDTITQTIINIR